ncbi:MAG: glycosyltransferase family 2 protein, partial [Kiritimatiellae bacterium]|nr:glycosyltransferase family 2 protein [Kiritimatiellia bacterium]
MVKVSVIIPTYNRSQMVCECIDSVLKSTFQDFEIVVVDDCSPDDTREKIAAAYGNEKRLRYIRNEKNSYQAASRNNGAEIAQGDYMLFLDDDNKVHPDMIEELLSAFARHEDAGLVAPLAIHQRSGKENLIWTLGS